LKKYHFNMKKVLITGGLGFIGNALIKELIKNKTLIIYNIDKDSNVSSKESLKSLTLEQSNRYFFSKIDICDFNKTNKIFKNFKPDTVFNLAAESHVDNSISSPKEFINSNIVGTFNLLQISKNYLEKYKIKNKFKFIQISTDEVYGSLKINSKPFTELNKYLPNSPYSASKASAELLVRAWNKTYDFPSLITNCSNNYGPWQFPEKLIPLVISRAINFKDIPVYGDGQNIRDWIYVNDHAKMLIQVAKYGVLGENYNIGANYEITNLDLIKKICNILNKIKPTKINYNSLIKFVNDRPGHDFRYAINSNKLNKILKIKNTTNFDKNLKETIIWYLKNIKWLNKNSIK